MKILLFITCLSISMNCLAQNNLIVATNGSDISGDGSIANPYETIRSFRFI